MKSSADSPFAQRTDQPHQATTWVKRESEQKYKADFAAGRTLGGKKAGIGGWGAGFGGARSSANGKGASWTPSWMKAAEPEPEPEPVVVEEVSTSGTSGSVRVRLSVTVRRSSLVVLLVLLFFTLSTAIVLLNAGMICWLPTPGIVARTISQGSLLVPIRYQGFPNHVQYHIYVPVCTARNPRKAISTPPLRRESNVTFPASERYFSDN